MRSVLLAALVLTGLLALYAFQTRQFGETYAASGSGVWLSDLLEGRADVPEKKEQGPQAEPGQKTLPPDFFEIPGHEGFDIPEHQGLPPEVFEDVIPTPEGDGEMLAPEPFIEI